MRGVNGGGRDAEGTWGEGRDVGGMRVDMVVGGTLSDVGGCGVCVLTPLSPPPGAVAAWRCGAVGAGGAGGGRSPPGTAPPLQTRTGAPRRPPRIRRDPRQVTPPTARSPRLPSVGPAHSHMSPPNLGHAPTVLEPPLIGGGSCWVLRPRPFRSGPAPPASSPVLRCYLLPLWGRPSLTPLMDALTP